MSRICVWLSFFLLVAAAAPDASPAVRLKDLGRFEGRRDNQLVGYGIVTGLAGTGDSPRNRATRQAMANLLSRFQLEVPADQILSRNVAMVMLTATLPPTVSTGDKIDVNVSSSGDARSLTDGSLILAELRGPDGRVYALAQGQVATGGYTFDANGNLRQKNHPTVGLIADGATIETPVRGDYAVSNGALRFLIKQPDAVTAQRIAEQVNAAYGHGTATVLGPEEVAIRVTDSASPHATVARIETLSIVPDAASRVVINARTGTIAAGGDIRIAPVTVTHGDLRIAVDTEYSATGPVSIFPLYGTDPVVVANSQLRVAESRPEVARSYPGTTVAELVASLAQARVATRDIISILQAIKATGALHAQIVTQ